MTELMQNDVPELIVCAACTCSDGAIVLGARHWDLWMHSQRGDRKAGHIDSQGFITNRGRFVGRKEAWSIAEREGQIRRKVGCDGVLYSENLY